MLETNFHCFTANNQYLIDAKELIYILLNLLIMN